MTLCIALVFLGVASGLNVSVFDDCVVSKLYGNIVNADDLHVYVVREAWGYLRVTTESLSETAQDCPIMFSVERNGMFDTWTLPTEQGHQKLSRTLCPRDILNGDQFRIHVSTIGSMTSRPIQYSLVVDNVQIELNSSMGQLFGVLTPFRPLVFKVDKSNMSREALVMVTSPDQTCCHLSVQSYDCPIYEIDRFGQSKASFQTMTTLGALMLPEKVSTVYVVLTMTCGDDPSVNMSSSLHKQISVNISNQMTSFDVGLALIAPIVLFSLVSLGTLCYFTSHGSLADDDDFTHDDPLDQVIQPQDNEESLLLSLESITSADCSRPRSTADELIERRVFPRRFMSVADLSLQDEKYLHKKFNVYAQLTVTVGLFYVIPVIQLVLQYQSAFLITGNEDLCYFNFLCTRKYMSITAFNNVFSNIGYCALGLLYLAVVTLRERNHELLKSKFPDKYTHHGLPQYFGLHYAMAVSLICEGIMSACYHVCPSKRNFQFDSTFMYIIAILNTLKIYECRHPDTNPHAYSTFSFLAIVILSVVIGAYFTLPALWIIAGLIHCLICGVLASKVYYMSNLNLNVRMVGNLWRLATEDGLFSKPIHFDRFVLIWLFILVNFLYAAFRVVNPPVSLANHLVVICMGNLFLYLIYYIVMKMHYQEPFTTTACVAITLASLLWASSVFLFTHRIKSWTVSPATSRSFNEPCILANFYDTHDLWHMISSLAIFFTFLTIITIDDGIRNWRRERIHVF